MVLPGRSLGYFAIFLIDFCTMNCLGFEIQFNFVSTPRGHEANTVRVSHGLLEELFSKYDDLTVKGEKYLAFRFKAALPVFWLHCAVIITTQV